MLNVQSRSITIFLAAVCISSFSSQFGFAAESETDKKLKEVYNKKNYTQTIKDSEAIIAKDASDVNAHYYLALSLMNTKQTAKAKKEFEWVVKNGKEASLVSYAQKALDSMNAGASAASSAATTGPKVLDFGAVWCIPCKKLTPIFDKVAESYKGRVAFVHYDCDVGEGKHLADDVYHIKILPTVVFVGKDGKPKSISNGATITEQDLIKGTEALLN
jgi:thioredoxin-like negative regulator of GroEL